MKRLSKVLNIWKNLEDSYMQFKQKDEKLTKAQFLKMLVGYDSNKSSPTALKALLMSEVDTYTAEEYKDYESLLEVLDSTYDKLSDDMLDIVDLDMFVYNIESEHFKLEDYDCFKKQDKRISIADSIESGILLDTVLLQDDRMSSYFLGSEQKGYVSFRNFVEVLTFLQKDYSSVTADPFLAQVYYILGNYVIKRNMLLPTIFLSSELFYKKDKELIIGSLHVPITKRNCIVQEEVTIRTLQQKTIQISRVEYFNKKLKLDYGTVQINCVVSECLIE